MPGEIDLFQLGRISSRIDLLADVTVACVEHAPRPGLPAHAEVETLGLTMIKVVLECAGGRPHVRQTPLAGQQQVGGVGGARRLGQRHALVLKIIALPDRKAHPLLACLRIGEPRDRGQRQLIRVADAIAAQIPVFGKELRKIELVDRGIECRYLILPAIRNVDIVGAWLERLRECLAEQIRVSLEDEAAIDAADRDDAVQMRLGKRRVVQIIMRHVQTGARVEEPRVAALCPRHARVQHRSVPGHERSLMEAHELAAGLKIKALPFDGTHCHQQLRLAKIRRRDRIRGVLKRLELLDPGQQ